MEGTGRTPDFTHSVVGSVSVRVALSAFACAGPEPSRGVRGNLPRCSPSSSASWSRGSLQRNSGGNLDGSVDWDSGLTLGGNDACNPARNRTSSLQRIPQGSGQSSGEGSGRSSPRRPSGSSSERDFGSYGDSYGGGIGGVRAESVSSELRIEKLGHGLAVAGECCILHIQRQWRNRKTDDLPMTKELGQRLGSLRKRAQPTQSELARKSATLRSSGEPSVSDHCKLPTGNWSLALAYRRPRPLPPPQVAPTRTAAAPLPPFP
jgi:hypothetical protein